MKQLEKQYTVF